ncbi:MAG: hypothetical protein ACYC61_14165 [Isosphaeraceae bacterium]
MNRRSFGAALAAVPAAASQSEDQQLDRVVDARRDLVDLLAQSLAGVLDSSPLPSAEVERHRQALETIRGNIARRRRQLA